MADIPLSSSVLSSRPWTAPPAYARLAIEYLLTLPLSQVPFKAYLQSTFEEETEDVANNRGTFCDINAVVERARLRHAQQTPPDFSFATADLRRRF